MIWLFVALCCLTAFSHTVLAILEKNAAISGRIFSGLAALAWMLAATIAVILAYLEKR
jgi:hypothetical protein